MSYDFKQLPSWSLLVPILAWLILAAQSSPIASHPLWLLFSFAVLMATVISAVHHAEVIAHKVGEPYGTLILAIAITVIESSLILSIMHSGGEAAATLARDTVFATVMIILSGIIGLCVLVGGWWHSEQHYQLYGANTALNTLAAILILTLVLPNYTITTEGPVYSHSQLAFIALVSIALYASFVFIQTVKHRNYFLDASDQSQQPSASAKHNSHSRVSTLAAWVSLLVLVIALTAVVLLAKTLSGPIEQVVTHIGAPQSLVGVVIACMVLMPEGLAAVRAARKNLFQTSLNLALGSALASIGLTIPVIAIYSIWMGQSLQLGIDMKSTLLLSLTLFITSILFATGRTNMQQGLVLLVIFAVYLFTSVVP